MSNWLGGGVQQQQQPPHHVLCRRRGSKKGASQLSVCTHRDAEKKTHKHKVLWEKKAKNYTSVDPKQKYEKQTLKKQTIKK
jgi:ribosomal protein L37E